MSTNQNLSYSERACARAEYAIQQAELRAQQNNPGSTCTGVVPVSITLTPAELLEIKRALRVQTGVIQAMSARITHLENKSQVLQNKLTQAPVQSPAKPTGIQSWPAL